ncbi:MULTISPECIES: alanine racemase [Actinoalloteichus]|uniref:Alanine racemase n=1 Tax=Actinoalloteichus fjordicus TaxID=1612552 RepID=A0AAC9LDY3_9PSEU|nr:MULTISPECIES: alanine racemase [Actinoalloteichus]APU15867.1 alanine racemase [Actinoalloteichus fjordicus]APU21929.1 alanine racemase [Actinoalloteichus sp. GBA129-24]
MTSTQVTERAFPVTPVRPPTLETLPLAVAANLASARARTRSAIMAVVKADGYGHGAVPIATAAVDAGAEWLGVTDLAEAATLRAAGLTVPILSWLNPAGVDACLAAAERIDVAVGSADELRDLLAGAEATVRVHLQLDTGMARGGCPRHEWDELLGLARRGQLSRRIDVVGLMGHLPLADQADPPTNRPAVARMHEARRAAAKAGLGPLIVHLSATAGALTDPATHFGMVRIGAGLVGIDPSETVMLHGASRLTASIVHSTTVEARTSVGYGGDHVTDRPTRLGVLGVGYADGIPRDLARDAAVEIHGRRCRIVGRVSMDQIVVDTGPDPVPRGTTATVFGPDGGATPSIHDWARWARTIPHTIVTGIGPRVRRSIG